MKKGGYIEEKKRKKKKYTIALRIIQNIIRYDALSPRLASPKKYVKFTLHTYIHCPIYLYHFKEKYFFSSDLSKKKENEI